MIGNHRIEYSRFVAIDFFCGAGGMTNGLIKSGINVLAGIDNEPLCRKTYLQNKNLNGSAPEFLCYDVFKRKRNYPSGQQQQIIDEVESLLSDYKRRSGYRRLKLVFAICAPCQPFTRITKIKLSDGRQFKRANDMNLLLTTIDIIKHFRPAAIICENVEGIGEGRSPVLARFRRQLSRAGYGFDAKVINAAEFGIPQNRRRTIGLGFDNAAYAGPIRIVGKDPNLRKRRTVRQVIGHLPAIAAGETHANIPNHRARGLSDLNLKRIACASPGESNEYLSNTPYGDLSLSCHKTLAERQGAPSFTDTYTRMAGNDVAPTITTKFVSITNGRFGHFDKRQNRAISPREAALLQTFPGRYVFFPEDNLEFTATLIGNAVPPKLAEFFGREIVECLSK